MKLSLSVVFVLAFFNSCIKEKHTSTIATLNNNTNHSILVLSYKSGIVLQNDTIRVLPNVPFELANDTEPGDVKVPGFNSLYFGSPGDSIVVIFDGMYSITHYFDTPQSFSQKYYLFESERNLGNPNSYEFKREKDKNDNYTNVHKYFFTEQDYLDAKE